MKYSNPEIPEGINYSKEHPLKEFSILVFAVTLLFLSAVLVLGMLAESLGAYVPFSAEMKIVALQESDNQVEAPLPIESYLQDLAQQLAAAQMLPDDMSVQVHYVDSANVNAFATLGGRIVVFRGLLEKVRDENALAMVIAHEIAHIKYRHPIKGLGRAVVIGSVVAMFNGAAGNDIVTDVLGEAGLLTALKFSRDQERMADTDALKAVANVYGHVSGADEVFRLLQQQPHDALPDLPEFFNSHPLTDNRIRDIQNMAYEHGWSITDDARKALPDKFFLWIKKEVEQ